MSTEIKTYMEDGTLAASNNASGRFGIDPRRRRFALNPGIYMAMLEPRESGRQEILLPNGLIVFRTTPMANDDYDNALKNGHNPHSKGRMIIEDYPAEYFLRNYIIRYGEMGGRELPSLTMMDDPQPGASGYISPAEFRKSAQGYFAALWPSFADIGHQCPSDLKECVTCRLWLIGDPSEGEPPHEGIIERIAALTDQDKVAELRREIVLSVQGHKEWLERKWAELVGELADRKNGAPALAKLGVAEHHVRRNLHEVEPSESATAASFGAEVAAANQEGMKQLGAAIIESNRGGGMEEVVRTLAERQNKTDEALTSLAESIKALVQIQTEKKPIV